MLRQGKLCEALQQRVNSVVTRDRLLALLVPFSVLFANVVNFSTQLLVPRYLPAEQYSSFATLWAVGQLVAVIVFEWMRFGVVRFSEGVDPGLNSRRKCALLVSYSAGCVVLCLIATSAGLFFEGELRTAIVVVAIYAVCQGVFDGRQALARAQFRNLSFAVGWILRSVLTLTLCIGAAIWFESGSAVLVALSIAYLVVSAYFLKEVDFLTLSKKGVLYEDFRFLAKYGAFVAVSSSLSAALPPLVRALLIDFGDKAEVAGTILALDLSQKALVVIGMLVNVMVLQRSIKIMESGDPFEKADQMRLHVLIATAALVPFGVLFYALQPILVVFLVPQEYKVGYLTSIGLATSCALLLCLRQFSIDSLFVVVGKSSRSMIAPIVAVTSTFCGAFFLNRYGFDPSRTVLYAMLIGLALSCVASIYFVKTISNISWPGIEVMAVVLGGGCMYGVVEVGVKYLSGLFWLPLICFFSVLVYSFVLILFDVGGVRYRFGSILSRK